MQAVQARPYITRVMSIVALVIGLGALGGPRPVMAGPASSTITVHAFWCEASGDAIAPACHHWDRNALDNAEFTVAGVTRWTLDGVVSWSPRAGEHTIQGANLIHYRGATVICTNQVTGMIPYAGSAGDDRVTITTTAGQETICDWYYDYER